MKPKTPPTEDNRTPIEILELRSKLDKPQPVQRKPTVPGTVGHAVKMYKEQGTPEILKTLIGIIEDYRCPECGKAMRVEFDA